MSPTAKFKIIDTNILLTDPDKALYYSFRPKEGAITYLILPIVVIAELDKFKHEETERGRNARQAARILKKIKEESADASYSTGIKIADNYFIRVVTGLEQDIAKCFRKADEDVKKTFPSKDENLSLDNRILTVAIAYQRRYGEQKYLKTDKAQSQSSDVELVTQDTNLSIKASAFGVAANDWEDIHAIKNEQEFYTGYKDDIKLSVAEYEEIFSNVRSGKNKVLTPEQLSITEYFPNQFFKIETADDDNEDYFGHALLAKNDPFENEICVFAICDGDNGIKRPDGKEYVVNSMRPRNYQQAFAMQALIDERISLVHLIGPAGTGKTLSALAAGLQLYEKNPNLKFLITKPIVSVGSTMGYLPGDKDEKLRPWMDCIADNLGLLGRNLDEMIKSRRMTIQTLEHVRGRSIHAGFQLVEEGQNLTPKEVKTLITRIAENSKIVLAGDPAQIDHPALNIFSTGILHSSEGMKDEKISATVYLSKGERSKLATIASRKL